MPLTPSNPAPYTTAAAAITAIEAVRNRGISTIDAENLTRAGVPESIASRTVHSLRGLDLINNDGELMQQFTDLKLARGEEEYRARLQEWLRAVYADVLDYANPAEHSVDRVAEAFRSYKPEGQRRAMAALFVGLWKYAGLPVPETNGTPRASTPRSTTRRPVIPRPPTPKPRRADRSDNYGDLPAGLIGLLQQIPRGGTWTTKRRDDFLKAFGAVLDFSVSIDDALEPETEDEGQGGDE